MRERKSFGRWGSDEGNMMRKAKIDRRKSFTVPSQGGSNHLIVVKKGWSWVRISARTPILREYHHGGDITGGFCPGAGFPSCHKSIYRVGEDNFRGSACVPEWMLISVKRWGVGLS
jgi:hypothetical protein